MFYKKHLGEWLPVLLESSSHQGTMNGFTSNYIKCELPYDEKYSNTIQNVILLEIDEEKEVAKITLKN